MNTYYTNDFEGHCPTGVAAVVVARDFQQARRRFNALLAKNGLRDQNLRYTIHQVIDGPAVMLADGDY